MKKHITQLLLSIFVLTNNIAIAGDIQNKGISNLNGSLKNIKHLTPDSSNAHDVELLLGKPYACLPTSANTEVWMCQWKGDLNKSGLNNTINITFEAGMIISIITVDKDGNIKEISGR